MARVAKGSDGFGPELVLGLLAERASNCYQLDRRLTERFGSAGYTQGVARQAIGRLVDDGFVRVVGGGARLASSGGGLRARGTVYEATQAGVERFEQWMWASVSTPPVREELHAKIALCRPADLQRMVAVVREAESVCTGKLQSLNLRVQSCRVDPHLEDFRARMDLVVRTGDQAWWDSRIKWLQRVRVYLEDEWKRYGVEPRSRMGIRRMG
jgi:DNA-binding PadR family transcriptional regulator